MSEAPHSPSRRSENEWSPPSFKLPGHHSGYELLCPVGTGQQGSVWMADAPREHPNQPCAVKFYTHEALDQPDAAAAFLEQARKAREILGVFLVRLHRVLDLRSFRADGWPAVAIVSPLIEPSLERVLSDLAARGERLPTALVTSWARHLFEAVESLHGAHRYVHGHIKPSNILLRLRSGQTYRDLDSLDGAEAQLSDLEGACPIGASVPSWWPPDEAWRAPEMSEPARLETTPAEDLYALGLVLQRITAAAEGELSALSSTAQELADPDPDRRLAAKRELRVLLFPVEGTVFPQTGERAVILRQSEARSGHLHAEPATSALRVPGDAHWPEYAGVPGYAVFRHLGSGGMGLVYEARDVALNRPVAIKTIRAQQGRAALERLRREATAMARLNHPNIVQIYATGEEGGCGYLIEELVEGPNLHQLVEREGPLPVAEAARIGQALAEAVAFAHDRRILHRDIKPSNVLLTPEGIPKLTDFGLAKLIDEDSPAITSVGTVMGTMAYMAPEQLRGEAADVRTDVYGIGATLYYLLTRRTPREARTFHELLAENERPVVSPREHNAEVPAALEEICLRCLAGRPSDRYATAGDVAEVLSALPGGTANPSPSSPATITVRTILKNYERPDSGAVGAAYLRAASADLSSYSAVECMLPDPRRLSLETSQAEKLRLLLEISNSLSKPLELDSALPKIADCLFQLFRQAERCFIIEADDNRLRPLVVRTRRPDDEADAQPSRTLVRRCLETAQAFLSDDASCDARIPFNQSIIGLRIRSVLCVPLCSPDDKAFGVIQLDTRDRGKKFTQDDLKLLGEVANQTAIALENARLRRQSLVHERFDRDLALGRRAQASFLPNPPKVAGYELAAAWEARAKVTGDFFDFIPLAGGRWAVCIGDVAGHGLPAALLAARFSLAARIYLSTEDDPARAVSKLNAQILEATQQIDYFITFALAVLDPLSHELTLINAGHISPMLYSPSTSSIREAMPKELRNLPLGMLDDLSFDAFQMKLAPGESLILLTDGVTDAFDAENKRCFGVTGLEQALLAAEKAHDSPSLQILLDGVVRAVYQHAADRSLQDDTTLVALRRDTVKEK